MLYACVAAGNALAVPAAPVTHALAQPDGTTFEARQWGDEWLSGWETIDGYTIVFDHATGTWAYAERRPDGGLVASASVVGRDTPPESIPPHLRPAGPTLEQARAMRASTQGVAGKAVVPPTGTANVPVILINFSDTTTTYTASNFASLLFGNGTWSMRDYYSEVSYGRFTVSAGPGGVAGWLTASNTHDYYGANNAEGKDTWPGDLVYDAVSKADAAGFNFAPYDSDGDCYVDTIVIVHQGTGEEASAAASDIWSYHWNLHSAQSFGRSNYGTYTTNDACPAGGLIKVDDFTLQPEIYSGGISTMGVYAHEYGHALGLPDLYDTDNSSEGVGKWSLMATGSWCGVSRGGDRPAHMDAWSKATLGWVAPHQVTGTLANEAISQAATSADVYQLLTGTPGQTGEYFLVENRQLVNFDAGLPGSGLLIWHVNEAMADNTKECYPSGPSCASQRYRVALAQADGLWHMERNLNRGDPGDPFPGSWNNTTLTDLSTPNSNLYSGQDAGVRVTNISASGSTMTATFAVLPPCSYTLTQSSASFGSTGGNGTFGVTTSSGCAWAALSDSGWLHVTGGASGNGDGTVSYSVDGNASGARTGHVTVQGQTFTVNQAGLSCTYSISPTQASFSSTGGAGSVAVTAGAGCAWTAASNAPWITITSGSNGTDTGAVTYSVAANSSQSQRTGTLTVAGQTFTVNQEGVSCSYSISPMSASVAAGAGTGSFNVSAGAGCAWAVSSDSSWLHVTAGASGSGNGTVSYSVDANGGLARSGTITVQGQRFTVSQAGQDCTYTLAPSSASFGVAGGSGSFSVSTSRGCPWEANASATWIHLIGNKGTGAAWLYFNVDANMGPPRSGAITVQSQVFAVAQAGEGNSFAFSHWIAAASHVDGAGNSHWRSDVAVLNRSSSQTTVEYRLYTPGSLRTHQVSLAGSAQDFRRDIAEWLGYSTGSGSLEVRSDQDVFVMGRTYNQADAAHTYGQNYDGQEPDASLLSTGQSAWLPLLAQNPSFRCNIAITNTGPTAASVTVTLYDGQGNQLWRGSDESDVVGPGAFIQYLKPFQKYGGRNDLEHCYAKVTVNSGSGVIVWASVVDEATGDPTTIFMQTGEAVMSNVSHWIAAVSHVDGIGSSHWRSDVAVLNRFSSQATVKYRLYTPGGMISQQVVLAGNAQEFHRDIAAWLGYTTGSGPLEVLSSQDVFVMARTYNQVDATRSYGQNYDGQDPGSRLLSAGQAAWLPLLAQNPGFRCNIAITNSGASTADVDLALYDGQGNLLWTGNAESSAIAPGGFIQYLKPFQKYGGRNDLEHAYARVTVNSGSGIIVWASVVDEATGDPTTVFMKR